MKISRDEMSGDLSSLAPEQKVEFILQLADQLIPVLREIVGDVTPFAEIYGSYKSVIRVGRQWLAGEIDNPEVILEPLEHPAQRPFDSLELEHKHTSHFGNLRVVGSMITDAIYYAGQVQHNRSGGTPPPLFLDEEITEDLIVSEFERTLRRADPELRNKFYMLWTAKFPDPSV